MPVDSVEGSIELEILGSALSVLGITYDEQEVRERLCPTFVHSVYDLQSACSAGWLTTYEFEEALLKLFTQIVAAAALSAPSPAGCNLDGLGVQDATAPDRGRECLSAPSPIP